MMIEQTIHPRGTKMIYICHCSPTMRDRIGTVHEFLAWPFGLYSLRMDRSGEDRLARPDCVRPLVNPFVDVGELEADAVPPDSLPAQPTPNRSKEPSHA